MTFLSSVQENKDGPLEVMVMSLLKGNLNHNFDLESAERVFAALTTVFVLLISLYFVVFYDQFLSMTSIERYGAMPAPRTPLF